MRHGIHLPLFGALAEPQAVVEIAVAAEKSGWDGLFVWDHVLSPVDGDWDIADPWVVLAAVAAHTRRIRLGPMVTPLPRRRLEKLARESVTLDRLSAGRLTLGLGTGRDNWREYSAFGDDGDPRRLGRVLDEGAAVLTELWSGTEVTHHGELTVDRVRLTPTPTQQPRIPVWFGTNRTGGAPIERAARYDGVFPLGFLDRLDPAGVARIAATVAEIRGGLAGFDIAVGTKPGCRPDADLAAAGATWAMHEFWPGDGPAQVLAVIEAGKPG